MKAEFSYPNGYVKVRSLQENKFIAVIKNAVLKHLVIFEESQKYLLKCNRRKKGI